MRNTTPLRRSRRWRNTALTYTKVGNTTAVALYSAMEAEQVSQIGGHFLSFGRVLCVFFGDLDPRSPPRLPRPLAAAPRTIADLTSGFDSSCVSISGPGTQRAELAVSGRVASSLVLAGPAIMLGYWLRATLALGVGDSGIWATSLSMLIDSTKKGGGGAEGPASRAEDEDMGVPVPPVPGSASHAHVHRCARPGTLQDLQINALSSWAARSFSISTWAAASRFSNSDIRSLFTCRPRVCVAQPVHVGLGVVADLFGELNICCLSFFDLPDDAGEVGSVICRVPKATAPGGLRPSSG